MSETVQKDKKYVTFKFKWPAQGAPPPAGRKVAVAQSCEPPPHLLYH